jgi:hypothetical protein
MPTDDTSVKRDTQHTDDASAADTSPSRRSRDDRTVLSRIVGRIRRRFVSPFDPGSFVLVMATGIISIAAQIGGMTCIAVVLFGVTVSASVVIGLLTLVRLCIEPRESLYDLLDRDHGLGCLTIVAGSCILGNQVLVFTDIPTISIDCGSSASSSGSSSSTRFSCESPFERPMSRSLRDSRCFSGRRPRGGFRCSFFWGSGLTCSAIFHFHTHAGAMVRDIGEWCVSTRDVHRLYVSVSRDHWVGFSLRDSALLRVHCSSRVGTDVLRLAAHARC